MVQKVAIRGLTIHPNHVNPLCFQLINCGITVTCNRFVGFLSSWLFLIVWSKNVFGRQQRFFPATTNIIKCCFRQKPKEGAPGRHSYIYIYFYLSVSLSLSMRRVAIIHFSNYFFLHLYSCGHLPVISGYKWDYTFYKWGFLRTYIYW